MRRHAKVIVATSAMLLTLALGATLAGAVEPAVTIDAPSAVSYTSAHVSGTVDPQDQETSYAFQYTTDPVQEGWNDGPGAFTDPLASGSAPKAVFDDLVDLKPGVEYQVRLVAENADGQTISTEPNPSFATDPVALPSVSIDPVTAITEDSAHFSGVINPQAPGGNPAPFDVRWHFECTPGCPGSGSGTISADNVNHAVTGDPSGLDPNVEYEVRLVADNAGGVQTDEITFTTDIGAPLVKVLDPGIVTDTSAQLGAMINPRNSVTGYYIEYSTDPTFTTSTRVPAGSSESIGAGNIFLPVSQIATGLAPSTIYYFRVVVDNGVIAPVVSPSVSFSTLNTKASEDGLPDNRVYEMVSPVDKAGAGIERGDRINTFKVVHQVAANGNAVVFGSKGNFGGDSGALYNQYVSRRGASGWNTIGITSTAGPNEDFYHWFLDSNLSLGVATVGRGAPLHPTDPDLGGNRALVLRDTTIQNDETNNAYRLLSSPSITPPAPKYAVSLHAQGASADGSRIVFTAGYPLTPESPSEGIAGVYEWVNETVHFAGILPSGAPASMNTRAGSGTDWLQYSGDNAISEDGSRLFFKVSSVGVPSEVVPLPEYDGLYVRENGATTRAISNADVSARFEAAKPSNGSVAFFTSRLPLTSGSPAFDKAVDCNESSPESHGNGCDLYRWDANAPAGNELSDLTTADPGGGDVVGTLGINDAATKAYFVAFSNLAPGAAENHPNIYLWEQGTDIRHVATLNDSSRIWDDSLEGNFGTQDQVIGRSARVSRDGNRLLFETGAQLTAYDTAGHNQIYLYDAPTDQIFCVSCSRISTSSSDNAHFSVIVSSGQSPSNTYGTGSWAPNTSLRNLSGDGRRAFFDTEEALLPADTNGKVDTYEWEEGWLYLISSGDSGADATFFGASESGNDVFFVTNQALSRHDTDVLIDIYDARIGGVADPAPIPSCAGDECQGTPSAAPAFDDPATAGQANSVGNVSANPKIKRCGKRQGKEKRKQTRCSRPAAMQGKAHRHSKGSKGHR